MKAVKLSFAVLISIVSPEAMTPISLSALLTICNALKVIELSMPEAENGHVSSLFRKNRASSFASPFRQLLSNHTHGQLWTQCL